MVEEDPHRADGDILPRLLEGAFREIRPDRLLARIPRRDVGSKEVLTESHLKGRR
jgi:hypothetical protein